MRSSKKKNSRVGRSTCTAPRTCRTAWWPSHKTGQVEHLFITADARGKGLGQKLLDFARKKLPEHAHPVLTVLDKNTRAIALYRRMGWKVCGVAEVFDPAKDGSVTARAELLEMRYDGPAEA